MLYLIVFLSGAVLMSLEMVGSRILAPTFGSSIYIWGALIVVVMAALTLGYYWGGRLADKYPSFLMMGTILAGAGFWVGLLPFWNASVSYYCAGLGPRTGSLVAATAFFFIPSVLMATTSPFAIKLASKSLTTIGNTAGHMSAVSSAGSIVGTLLTSFFLIPAMGVRNIVLTLGFILLGLALLIVVNFVRNSGQSKALAAFDKKLRGFLTFMIIIGLLLLVILAIFLPRRSSHFYKQSQILYERDSLYHHILVADIGMIRHLHFDNSYQSAMYLDAPLEMVFNYTSYLHLGAVVQPQPERVLFIGLGGGSAPKKFLHDYPSLKRIDVVEIDPDVVKVAYRYFGLPEDPKLQVSVRDGRLFIAEKAREIAAGLAEPYDMVIIDAYSESTIPYHLTTVEFLEDARRVLTPNGVVVSNIVGALAGSQSRLLASMTRTFRTVFPQVYLFPVDYWAGTDEANRNIILIASLNPEYWEAKDWQNRAAVYQGQGLIKENVAGYTQDLVRRSAMLEMIKKSKAPLLSDDYAPVDTLQHPLL